MYISEVRLRDIRGFHDERDVNLTLTRPDGSHAGWTVIAGRNGSGKTSLLRAIALAVSGPAVARSLIPDFGSWISSGKSVASAELFLSYDPNFEGFVGGGRTPSENKFDVGLEWHLAEGPTAYSRSGQPSLRDSQWNNGRTLQNRGPWQDNPAGWFCAAYGPFRRLVGGGGDAQRLMLSPGPVARLVSLFHEDASLAEGVGWLIDQHLRALERKPGADDLKLAVLKILDDGLLPDEYKIEGLDSDGLWVVRHDLRFPLREMSDGYRTVVALVVDLIKQLADAYGQLNITTTGGVVQVNLPGVVIVDEIDAHLHVSWQQRIGPWLKQHFPLIQFIVTTHSPYVCQAADPGGLIRLPGPDEAEPPRIVAEDLYERIVYGTGDDAVLSELFGLDTPYSSRAVVLREQLAELEFQVASGLADERSLREWRELRETLSSSPAARVDEAATRMADDDR
jgi:energy-coupling factor transporter ATP-binding protein EcfA2